MMSLPSAISVSSASPPVDAAAQSADAAGPAPAGLLAVHPTGVTLGHRGRIGPSASGRFGERNGMRKQQGRLIGILVLLGATTVSAAELEVRVNDRQGKPVADAVVTVVVRGAAAPAGGKTSARAPASRRVVDQKALAFTPYVEVFRPGDEVAYRNSDRTRHHVYSFSPIKAFEFMLAPGETSPSLKLERSGVIAVGCNIHDGMINYLYISDAPWIARTDARGVVAFRDLPVGAFDVRVWQPRLPPKRPDLVQSGLTLRADERRSVSFALTLLPDSRLQFDREHTRY
jgi:plastocyanin